MNSSVTSDPVIVRETINSAANAALCVIHFNGATYMAERAFNNIIHNSGISDVRIIWRLDILTIIFPLNGKTETIRKPVVSVGTNLINLSKVMELSESVRDGKTQVSDIDAKLKEIIDIPFIHNRWVYVLLDGLAAAFYLKFHHGPLVNILIVFAAAMAGEIIRYKLQTKVVQVSRIIFICSIISTGFAGIVMRLADIHFDMVTMIASVIYLVPGLRIINGFFDVANQRFLYIGIQRLINALFLFLILGLVITMVYIILNFK